MIKSVLEYYRLGWSVIPLYPATKIAAVEWKAYQSERMSAQELTAYWENYPTANIGVVCGRISDLVVLDCDGLEALKHFLKLYPEAAQTRTAKTGEGWHYYFSGWREGIGNDTRIFGHKIDYRAEGGLIVAAPSIHDKTGLPYRWINDNPIQPLPESLAKLLIKPKPEAAQTTIEGTMIPAGHRNVVLAAVAGLLQRKAISGHITLKALKAIRDACCDQPSNDPVTDRELEAMIRSLSRHEPGDPLPPLPKAVITTVADVEKEDVSWLLHRRIPMGKLTMIDGDPGVSKSYLSVAFSAAVSVGHGLPGEESCEPQHVILMSAEDGIGDTIRPRLESLGGDPSRVHVLRTYTDVDGKEKPLTLDHIEIIEQAIQTYKPALLVIDPVIAFLAGVDSGKPAAVREKLAPLANLAEKYNVAIVAIRHLNKSTLKVLYRGQGSMDFIAAARSCFIVAENPADPTQKFFCHIKNNLGPKMPTLTYTIDAEGRFAWGGEDSSITADQLLDSKETKSAVSLEQAKEFLRKEMADGPVDSDDLWKACKAHGINWNTYQEARKVLKVRSEREGLDGPWLNSLPPEEMPQ